MYCTNCGSIIDDNAKFCTNCGTRVAYPAQPVSSADTGLSSEAPASATPDVTGSFAGTPQDFNTQDVQPSFEQFTDVPQQTSQVTPVPAGKPKKKKGGLIAVIAILAVALLGFGGYMIYKNSPKQKALVQLELAQEAFSNYDYDAASAHAREALALNPELEEAKQLDHDATVQTMYTLEYDQAVKLLVNDMDLYPEFEEEDMDHIDYIYESQIEYLLDSEDYDSASEVIAVAEQMGFDYTDYKNVIARHNANVAFYASVDDLAQSFSKAFYEAPNSDTAMYDCFHVLMDKLDPILINIDRGNVDAEIPLISNPVDTGECIGIYKDPTFGYTVYFGNYDGDKRSGLGMMMYYEYTEGTEHIIDCDVYMAEFVNDVPNGQCTAYAEPYLSDSEFVYSLAVTGTVVDGIFEGDCVYQYYGEDELFYGKYKNGILQVIDEVDPNGDPAYVVLYNEDKTLWYAFEDPSQINQKIHEGVMGYAYTEP